MDIFIVEDIVSLLIHDFTLLAQDVIILQQGLTGIEVDAFHPLLGRGNRLGYGLGLDGFITQGREDTFHALTAEADHQIILYRDKESGFTRITLTAGTSAQLVVDTPGFMPFGTKHAQTAQFPDTLAELDVGTAAGHVGGDGNRALLACFGDDFGFSGIVLGVQHFVRDLPLLQQIRDQF